MPLNIKQQTSILQLILTLFNTSPGGNTLNHLIAQLETGQSLENLAQKLAESVLFFDKQYEANLSSAEFASALTEDLLGNRISGKNKSLIMDYIVHGISAGSSQIELISELINVLSSTSTSDPNWGGAVLHYNIYNATKIVNHLLGDTFTAENKTVVIEFILTQMKAGKTFGEMIVWGIKTLVDVDHDNPVWGNAAKMFDNRVEVSRYYSVDKAGVATDLATLQRILSGVTANPETIDVAKAEIDKLQDNSCMRIQHNNEFRLDEVLRNMNQNVLSAAKEQKFA